MTCATLLLPSITLCCSIYPKYKSWTFFPFWDQPSSPLHHHIIAALLLVFIICGWETLFKFFLLWVYLNDKVSLPHVVTQWHRYHNDDVGSWEVPYLDHVQCFNSLFVTKEHGYAANITKDSFWYSFHCSFFKDFIDFIVFSTDSLLLILFFYSPLLVILIDICKINYI